jgi:hypothetical protein
MINPFKLVTTQYDYSVSAPLNLYIITDSVTSLCIPSCLYLAVPLARYLQHGHRLLFPCFYRGDSCEDEVPE